MKRPHVIHEMEYFEPERGGKTIQQILDSVSNLQNPVICFIKAGESSFAKDWIDQFDIFVQELRSNRSDLILHLTASVWHQDQEHRLREIFDSVLFVVADLVRPYYNLIVEPACTLSSQWNKNSDHFLVLTGKPDKYHRVGLLYQLDQARLLDKSIWSLHMMEQLLAPCSTILSEMQCKDSISWINDHINNPDQSDIIKGKDNLHYTGIPFGKKIYDTPKFQIVSETDFENNQPAWITEKTILAIANRNPFLIAGVPGTLENMRNLGFETFEQFCLHTDYDRDIDSQSRMQKIIENTRFWLDNLLHYEKQIERGLEDNFSRFVELGKEYLSNAGRAIKKLNIDCDAKDILPIFDPITHASWKQWYSRIKDPLWPDCDQEEDFDKLPKWIQNECIEVFGYQPKEKQ